MIHSLTVKKNLISTLNKVLRVPAPIINKTKQTLTGQTTNTQNTSSAANNKSPSLKAPLHKLAPKTQILCMFVM